MKNYSRNCAIAAAIAFTIGCFTKENQITFLLASIYMMLVAIYNRIDTEQ